MPGENFWRTMMSSAVGLWRSLDRLHDQYIELTPEHPGKVPVVELLDVTEIKARTTSYMPSFGITGWIGPNEVLQRPTHSDLDDDTRSELRENHKAGTRLSAFRILDLW